MPGVRLVHDSQRGGVYLVEHPTRRYKLPYLCPLCNMTHEKKTYHLNLDGEGACIVSGKVFHRLREAGLPNLKVSNEVREPPPITLKLDAGPDQTFFPVGHHVSNEKFPRLTLLKNKLITPRTKKYG